MGRKNNYLIDIVLCICVVSIALLFWYQGLFAQYAVYFLLWLHIFVVTLLLRSVPLKTSPSHRVDIALFMKENKRDKYYAVKYFFLINRHYIFPIILVVYLIFLLVGQTKLWGLEKTVGRLLLNIYDGNVLLLAVILSGIATVFQETIQEKYSKKVQSLWQTKLHLFLSVVLSTLSVYILFGQTQGLGIVAYPISIIAGVLLFLIGVMILEEDKAI